MIFAIIALSLLLVPFSNALGCNNVAENDNAFCNDIASSDISDSTKQQLMADIAYPDHDYANHSAIYDRNTAIQFNQAPDGVATTDSGSIHDAWLKIVAVMPSVISGSNLLTPGIGKLQTAYNYRIEMPSGNDGGDCYTEHNLKNNQASLSIFLNGIQIGTSTLTDFQGSNELNFRADLKIQSSIEVKHSRNFQECCYSAYYGCLYYCNVCKYDNTEYRNDEINLEDVKLAIQDWPVISPQIKAIDKYSNTTVGMLNISDFDAFQLTFANSSLSQFNYHYDLNVSLPPYDVYTLRANNFTRKESNNLNFEQINNAYKFFVANPENCKLKFYDHFHSWMQECNLKYNGTPIKIITDKLQYDENEIINVSLEPKNSLFRIKYGEEEANAQNFVQFAANVHYNKISAYLGEKEFQQFIHVKRKDTWNFALNLGVFSSILYFIYSMIKKYWGALF